MKSRKEGSVIINGELEVESFREVSLDPDRSQVLA